MGERLIRWPVVAAAALAAMLAIAAQAEGQDRAHGHGHELARHRPPQRADVAQERRLIEHRRWAQHWRLRHRRLVFDRALPHAPVRHPPPHPSTPPNAGAPRPLEGHAALVHPHRQRLALLPVATPVRLEPAPVTPLGHAALALPVLSAQAPPAATPAQADAAPAVNLATQLGQLTVAAAEVMKGARLDVPSALAAGGEGKVVLTLPPALYGALQAKAGQVGLGGSARKAYVTARLAGQGYGVIPNQEQTARLQTGEPTVFSWQVKPSAAAAGVLTAEMTGSLQGDGGDKTFALGAVTAQIPIGGSAASAPAPIQAPAARPLQLKLPDLGRWKIGVVRLPDLSRWSLRSLAIPGHPVVSVPGFGPAPSYKVVAAGLAALAVLLLLAVLRSARARREHAARRRRFHSFESASFSDEHP